MVIPVWKTNKFGVLNRARVHRNVVRPARMPTAASSSSLLFSSIVRKRFAPAGQREKLGVWPQRYLELRDEGGSLVLCWSYKSGDESHGRLTLHGSTLLEAVASKPRQIRITNTTPHATACSPVSLTIECPSVGSREAWQSAISQALGALPVGRAAEIREERFDASELYSIFPDVDPSVVDEALGACGGDKQAAVERVLDMLRNKELAPPEECVVCFDAPRQTRFSCAPAGIEPKSTRLRQPESNRSRTG